jgi:hypothetical protein
MASGDGTGSQHERAGRAKPRAVLSPHPEQRRSRVSNDEARGGLMVRDALRAPHHEVLTWKKPRLHAVTFKHFPAGRAEPGTVLLQASLNRAVVSQILAAEALGIPRASLLLPGCAAMLRQSQRHIRNQKH